MSIYITTPIFYVNAHPHLGHAYTTIIADTVCRYRKLRNQETFFQTGTDEHGDKIAEAANKADVTPEEYTDKISQMFRQTWPPLNIEYDNFIRTTDEKHIKTVQSILQMVYDKGDIYFSDYSGHYCQGCERFLTEKELVDGNCPDHLKPPELIAEQNYFFRMSKYQDWLIDHIKQNPEFITPERYRNEVLSFLKEPLEDLCISRPTSRLTWGIPIPFDERFVTYVWFDALINYLTGIGYPNDADFEHRWDNAEHIIAKDILKPHAIYWPTMLKAMGLKPYRKLHVHGYWNVNETKMSKSIGNVVRPAELVGRFGADTTRYFLLREMSFGLDASFSFDAIIARQNSDLANDLGNLFSRSLTMVKKFADGAVPAPGDLSDQDLELVDATLSMTEEYKKHMDNFAFHKALQTVWEVIGLANKYIVTNAPWELAKDPDQSRRLTTVLHTLLETLSFIALTLKPIMPETAEKMARTLGMDENANLEKGCKWGLLSPGAKLNPGPQLFPRMEKDKKSKKGEIKPQPKKEKHAQKQQKKEMEPYISFDDFKKIDLRVAEISAAEKVEKSDRLLKLTVKAPEERTVVAGIAEHYSPEDIIGKQVILVANLAPAKLMGILSQGMVLAVKDGDRLVLTGPSDHVQAGNKVS